MGDQSNDLALEASGAVMEIFRFLQAGGIAAVFFFIGLSWGLTSDKYYQNYSE